MSSLFGKGKESILRLLCSNNEISDVIAHAFLDPNTSNAGPASIVLMSGSAFDAHCISDDAYIKQLMSGKIKPQCLPTTENTAFQHGQRVFQQCREWMLLDPDLTDTPFTLQWDRDRRMFMPVYTTANQWQPMSSRLSFRVTVNDPAPRTSTITPWTV